MTLKIEGGTLFIRGQEVFLFGGEVQYFRLRDRGFDAAVTCGIWADTLDKMAAAGMNLVTTYVPWDYHERVEGSFDFSGARDLDRFLDMCHERDFHVQVKPGPYITAEWPNGPGHFGAVPRWLKDNYPQTLVRTAKGKIFTFGPLPWKIGRQCSYLHPKFLDKVATWYKAVAPIFLKYIHDKPCIWSVQIDNETNFFWTNRHHIDYNPVAIEHYRKFLKNRYVDIGRLNQRYRSRYNSFDPINPPRKPQKLGIATNPSANSIHIDWYDAGWEYIKDYLSVLRQILESTGIKEPDILFTTNDTPSVVPLLAERMLFWRGDIKNRSGLPTLDSYPRSNPMSRQLDDVPFQTDSFTELMDFHSDAYPFKGVKDGPWVMGAEMQGGFFSTPVFGIKVSPEATSRQITKGIGAGMKAYAVFVIRQGYNANNSIYHFQAGIDEKGWTHKRFDVLANASLKLARPYGNLLNRAEPVRAPVAVITNSDYQVPLAGTKLDTIGLWNKSYGGAYGWLKRAGYLPRMIEIKNTDKLDPGQFKVAMYIDPGLMGAREADMLTDYMENGGTLIHSGWPSDADLSGTTTHSHKRFRANFSSSYCISYRKGNRLSFFRNGERFDFRDRSIVFVWELPKGAEVLVRVPQGGWAVSRQAVGKGVLIKVNCDFSRVYNTARLYKMTEENHAVRALLAKIIMESAGIERPIEWSPLKVEIWASKAPGGRLFIFCLNDGPRTGLNIRLTLPETLGLEPGVNYRVKRIYKDGNLAAMEVGELRDKGVSFPMDKWESEVLLIEPG